MNSKKFLITLIIVNLFNFMHAADIEGIKLEEFLRGADVEGRKLDKDMYFIQASDKIITDDEFARNQEIKRPYFYLPKDSTISKFRGKTIIDFPWEGSHRRTIIIYPDGYRHEMIEGIGEEVFNTIIGFNQ